MYNIGNIFYREQALNNKPLLKLVFALIAVLLSGYFTKAIAWFGEDLKFIVPPSFLVGYMLPTNNYSLNVYLAPTQYDGTDEKTHRTESTINTILQSAKMEGLWLELVLPARTNYPVGFTTTFGYLVPSQYRIQESYKGSGAQQASRTWQTQTNLYNIKFSVDFMVTESLTGMAGVLYDSLSTSFSNPENISINNNDVGMNYAQEGNAAVNVILPFIGLQYEQPLRPRLDLKAYVIGFPGLLGSVSFQESVNYKITWPKLLGSPGFNANTVKFDGGQQISFGYFYEAFVQLSTPIWRGIGAGAFLKYSEYSAKLDHLDMSIGLTQPVVPKADMAFSRKPLIIGATIMATF